jgi:hypothetical protein
LEPGQFFGEGCLNGHPLRIATERAREWASREFSQAIRDTAANMLRMIRGAGKPYEVLLQMRRTIDSAIKFQELHDHWPSSATIVNALQLEGAYETAVARARERNDQASIDRWTEDGTFDEMMAEHTILCGALQIVASELVGQTLQKQSGEREFHDGIREWVKVHDERMLKRRQTTTTSRPGTRKPKARKPTSP